jgi:predicted Zn finger-like uncharacterized protein
MNVSCPQCSTVYRVDPAKVPADGVRARCSACGGVIPVGMPGEHAGVSYPAHEHAAAGPASRPMTPVATPRYSPARPTQHTPPRPAALPPLRPTPRTPWPPVSAAPPASQTPPSARPFVPSPTPVSVPAVTPPPPAPVIRRASASAAQTHIPSTFTPVAGARGVPAPGERRPINPFLARDPSLRAKRLARALVSDMVAYYPAKHSEGLQRGTLKELFREEIKKSYDEYVMQVGSEFARTTTYFQEALNEVLGAGKRIF